MSVTTLQAAPRPRAYVSVIGPDAASYLNRMVSNEVEELDVGASGEALLLTPKARIVAPVVVVRRAHDDFLLLTEPEAGERLARELLRARFAAKCAIELEKHRSVVVCRLFLDWSTEQTAAALDIAPGTVKSRLHRALRSLQPALAPER